MPAATIAQVKEMGRRNRPAGAPGNQKGVYTRIHETLKVHTGFHQDILRTLQEGLLFEKQKEREEDAEAAAESLDIQGRDTDISGITKSSEGMPAMPSGLKKSLLPLLLLGLGGVVFNAVKGLVGGLSEVVKGLSWARFIRKFDFISDIGKLFKPLGTLFKNLPGMKGASAAAGAAGGALRSIIDIIPGGKWITALLKKGVRAIPFVNALFGIFEFVQGFMEDYNTTEGTEGQKIIAGFGGGLEALIQFFVDDLLVFIQDGLAFAAKWLGFEGIGEKIKNFNMPDFSELFADIYDFVVKATGGGTQEEQKEAAKIITDSLNEIKFALTALMINDMINIVNSIDKLSLGIFGDSLNETIRSLTAKKYNLAETYGVDPTRFPKLLSGHVANQETRPLELTAPDKKTPFNDSYELLFGSPNPYTFTPRQPPIIQQNNTEVNAPTGDTIVTGARIHSAPPSYLASPRWFPF